MKIRLFLLLCLLPVIASGQDATLKTPKDKVSYSIGLTIGEKLKSQKVEIDLQMLARGIGDAFTGKKPALTDAEIMESLKGLQTDLQAKAQQQADNNKKQGTTFLAANAKKPGVVSLPSGLQYKVIKTGAGPKPKATDTVVAHYRGTLMDGTEFDSSYKRGEPANLPVNGVIKGWTEALQLMPVGSKWELYVPPELAYGDRGAGDVIGPNQTLIFQVELLSIKPASATTK